MRSTSLILRFVSVLSRSDFWLILMVFACGVLISLSIHPGHNWEGDFALYVQQAEAILDGSMNSLYELNKYSMQHSISEKGPYLYPNGFPLLLTPVYYFFNVDLIKMKMLCAVFLLGSIPLMYSLFREYFSNGFQPLVVVALVAFNVFFIQFADSIRSDLPFLFFSLLSFWLMVRGSGWTWLLLLGACLFFTYFIRDVGIFLLPALFVFQLFSDQDGFGKFKAIFVPCVVFIGFWALNVFVFPNGGENHMKMLFERTSIDVLILNFDYYVELISVYFLDKKNFLLGLLILILAGIGVASDIERSGPFAVYVLGVLGMVFIWPSHQGVRFLLPVLPFITLFLLKGSLFLTDRLRLPRKLVNVGLLVAIIAFVDGSIDQIVRERGRETNQSCTEEMMEIYTYVSREIPTNSVVGFSKPRILSLFSGVNAIYTDLTHFEKSVATHLIINANEKELLDITEFNVNHRFKNYLILEK